MAARGALQSRLGRLELASDQVVSPFAAADQGLADVAAAVADAARAWFDTDVTVVRRDDAATALAKPLPGGAKGLDRVAAGWHPDEPVHLDAEAGLTLVALGPTPFAIVARGGHIAALASSHDVALREAGLALRAADAYEAAQRLRREIDALEGVTAKILSLRDLDQALLSTANVVLDLLGADMAGVLLLDGDELAMRCCVGNESVATTRLRMASGCGVAGQVIAIGRPVNVESYLNCEHITHDFDGLARIERARSAAAAPLLIRGETIGVLEVWRRRRTAFTEDDMARLVALANLAAIAIDNATLFDQAQRSLARLAVAETSLSEKVSALQHSAENHLALSEILLEGGDLYAIARTVASVVGGEVAILASNLSTVAVSPRQLDLGPVHAELARHLGRQPGGVNGVELASWPGWLTAKQVRVGVRPGGWVCVLSPEPPTALTEIITGNAAVHTALWQIQAETAERALSEAKERMLWDLLEGSVEQRRAAAGRATRMRIELQRPSRVLVGQLDGIDDHATDQGWDTTRVEEFRHSLRARFVRLVTTAGAVLADMQEDRFVAVVPDRQGVDHLAGELADHLTGAAVLVTRWGVSAAHPRPDELGVAFDEATAALRVATRLGRQRWAVFDRLGLVQYLVGPVDSVGLERFAADVVGPLVEADAARPGGGELLTTLRAYLSSNCSQQEAAQELFIHHKTMRYRLERIEKLTGLDLRLHEDRVRAELALRIAEMTAVATAPR